MKIDLSSLEVKPVLYGNSKKRIAVPESLPEESKQELDQLIEKYESVNGAPLSNSKLKRIRNKRLRSNVERREEVIKTTAIENAKAQFLLLDGGSKGFIESSDRPTCSISQKELTDSVDASVASRKIDLNLNELGPYGVDFTRSGRKCLLFGEKGHLAVFDSMSFSLLTEIQAKQTIRDATFLHNETMIAVAQKNFVHIYDNKGIELHCLRNHRNATSIEFLPFHFLLASISSNGWLRYQDTSTGQVVGNIRTALGPGTAFCQNPNNGLINIGHNRGLVTMWAPKISKPVVKIIAERGQVVSMAVPKSGRQLLTTGMNGTVKLWDIRNFKEAVQVYHVGQSDPVTSLGISQTGLVALGHGNRVEVWRNMLDGGVKEQYLSEYYTGKRVNSVQFMPYDDFLGVGLSDGFSTMITPGAGESNFDSYEANPFEMKRQRQEKEVRMLLDKIQPEMITMDSNFVGNVDTRDPKVIAAEVREEEAKLSPLQLKEKRRMRGRSSAKKKFMRKKRLNIIDKDTDLTKDQDNAQDVEIEQKSFKSVLDRFK